MWKYMGGPDNNRNIRTDRTSVFYGHGDLLRRKHMLAVFDIMASFVHPRAASWTSKGCRSRQPRSIRNIISAAMTSWSPF